MPGNSTTSGTTSAARTEKDTTGHRHFMPAAGHDLLLPFYDPLNRLLGEQKLKGPLVDRAGLLPGHRVLDIGCGTGALSLIAKRRQPGAEVVGLDPDPKALARARSKAERAGLAIRFEQGFANELPFEDASFDRVLSSLMLHHLGPDVKRAALREAHRVLGPGGSLHVLDFGPPRSALSRLLTALLHHGDYMRDNLEGRIPDLMGEAGFADTGEVSQRSTWFGTIWSWCGVRQ